jgi:hypothetical protein
MKTQTQTQMQIVFMQKARDTFTNSSRRIHIIYIYIYIYIIFVIRAYNLLGARMQLEAQEPRSVDVLRMNAVYVSMFACVHSVLMCGQTFRIRLLFTHK